MFSLKRLSNQFKILVYQNYTRHGIFILIYVFYLIYMHLNLFSSESPNLETVFSNFGLAASLAGIFFSIDTFSKLRSSTGSGIMYLTVPATIFEKFLSSLLYSTIFTFITFSAVYLVFHIVLIFTGNVITGSNLSLYIPEMSLIWEAISDMLFFQSLYFFGALIFKKNQFGKTTAIIVGFIILTSIIGGLILKYSLDNSTNVFENSFTINLRGDLSSYTINGVPLTEVFENFKTIIIALTYIIPVAMWTGSYFRLKKIQI